MCLCTHICLPFRSLSDFLPICSPSFSLSHDKQHGTYLRVPRNGPLQKELALTAKEPPDSREADSLRRHHKARLQPASPVCAMAAAYHLALPCPHVFFPTGPSSGCHESCAAFPKTQDLLQSRFSELNLTTVGKMHAREKQEVAGADEQVFTGQEIPGQTQRPHGVWPHASHRLPSCGAGKALLPDNTLYHLV